MASGNVTKFHHPLDSDDPIWLAHVKIAFASLWRLIYKPKTLAGMSRSRWFARYKEPFSPYLYRAEHGWSELYTKVLKNIIYISFLFSALMHTLPIGFINTVDLGCNDILTGFIAQYNLIYIWTTTNYIKLHKQSYHFTFCSVYLYIIWLEILLNL